MRINQNDFKILEKFRFWENATIKIILTIGTDGVDSDFLAKLASKTELSVKVLGDRLEQGVTSMAKMLPLSGKGVGDFNDGDDKNKAKM